MPFKVVKDNHMEIYYVRKKFMGRWFKFCLNGKNIARTKKTLLIIMEKGRLDISTSENSNYFYLMDTGDYTEEIYEDLEDFRNKNAEFLI